MAKSLKSIVVLCGFAVRCNTKLKTDGQDNWHNEYCYLLRATMSNNVNNAMSMSCSNINNKTLEKL